MKKFGIRLNALLTLLLFSSSSFAATDFYLKIEGTKGESQVVHCTNGSCVVPPLKVGDYTVLVCTAEGEVIPGNLDLMYSVVSPRDAASGLATGKRQHKALTITMELGRGATPGNIITIDEAGSQIALGVDAAGANAALSRVIKTRSNIQNN